jgi:hypothetical protein
MMLSGVFFFSNFVMYVHARDHYSQEELAEFSSYRSKRKVEKLKNHVIFCQPAETLFSKYDNFRRKFELWCIFTKIICPSYIRFLFCC